MYQFRSMKSLERFLSPEKNNTLHRAIETCHTLLRKPGIHSVPTLKAAGFYYTNKDDSVLCDVCQLEVSNWEPNMNPFTIHKERSPNCSFVLSILPDALVSKPATIPFTVSNADRTSYRLVEIDKMKVTRVRTFTNWPHETSPSSEQLIAAGFFDCCVGDRVICLYCNLICQQWMPNTDDPWKVHTTYSPNCPYVVATLEQNGAVHPPTDSTIPKRSNIKDVNWFPHCTYAQQLCLKELYRKIKKSRSIQSGNTKQLKRLINSRLDLPVSINLVAEGFDLLIIQSCYENRFRLTGDDFIDDCDLRMACTILQKQIKLINGNEENIIVPPTTTRSL